MSCSCGNKCCKIKETVIPAEEVERFAKECLLTVNVSEKDAEIMAKVMTENDRKGIQAFGLRTLNKYINQVQHGSIEIKKKPKILKETCATAWVDGRNCFGVIVGDFCMKLAIEKAKKVGIGFVSCKGSNEFTTGATYSTLAAKEGFIGFSCSNGFPAMGAPGSHQRCLGSNPLSVSAPPFNDEGLMLDMALTATSFEKISVLAQLDRTIPANWALDEKGNEVTDPKLATTLTPLGWPSFHYKGFGLALMVETLTSILSGADYGMKIAPATDPESSPKLSHTFFAIDPDRFAPCFPCRMSDLMTQIRTSEPINEDTKIILPGDPERNHQKKVKDRYGIGYPHQLIEEFLKLAQLCAVSPLKPLPPLEMILKPI